MSSSKADLGAIVWVAVNPMIQLVLVGGVGNLLAQYGILDNKGTKVLSKIYIQALVPSLLFSKMVASVTREAVNKMIIVVPFVLFYMLLGLLFGMLGRRLFRNRLPQTFNYSLLVASIWSNWGDIPLAVVNNFTSSPPFKKEDAGLGVAYISVFLIIFYVVLFPLGGHKLIAIDFKSTIDEKTSNGAPEEPPIINQEVTPKPSPKKKYLQMVTQFLISLLSPVNLSIILGLVIGLSPAKDLFVKGENNPYLVQGITPPLFIIHDTAQFLGNACVPIGVLNLGAALVKVNFKEIPLSLNLSLAVFKLIIMPLISIPIVYWCAHGLSIIDPTERALQLVLMLGSGIPTATTTLVLTQFYNPQGEAQHIASLLVVQYLIGFFTMTICLGTITYLLP